YSNLQLTILHLLLHVQETNKQPLCACRWHAVPYQQDIHCSEVLPYHLILIYNNMWPFSSWKLKPYQRKNNYYFVSICCKQ
uniref:Secreted protein n=1 Tax=Ciona intestinalis TaxID=7719 RepID=H2XZ48_CIOIN